MAAYGTYVPPPKRSSDIGHVMMTIVTALQWIGLVVEPQSWSVATDEDGVVLKLRWLQQSSHRSSWRRQDMEKSGNTDIGMQNRRGSPQRKRKSPSKTKRDKERWERHSNRKQQLNNQVIRESVKIISNTAGGAVVDTKSDKAVKKDDVPCGSRVYNASDISSAPAMDISVNHVTSNLNVNANVFQPSTSGQDNKEIKLGRASVEKFDKATSMSDNVINLATVGTVKLV